MKWLAVTAIIVRAPDLDQASDYGGDGFRRPTCSSWSARSTISGNASRRRK